MNKRIYLGLSILGTSKTCISIDMIMGNQNMNRKIILHGYRWLYY